MRAIVVRDWTEPKNLHVEECPEPEVPAGGLGIDVRAAGCNFFDILMVQGKYQVRPPFPFTPGAEIAGVVREVGSGVKGFAVGDQVFASSSVGAFAERAAIAAKAAYRMPKGMSFEEGAAFPIVYPTSYAGLVFRANLRAGENLLVHAAAGGVGIAAVQIGKALGARVIATAGGEDKLEVARAAGADVCIDYRATDWVEEVKKATGGKGADVIYDSVGGDIFDGSLKCIAWNGRLLVIGFASGRIPEVKANRILLKNISIVGLHWGAHVLNEPERIKECFDALFDLYAKGAIRPVIYKTFSLDQVPAALEALGSRQSYGKVIVPALTVYGHCEVLFGEKNGKYPHGNSLLVRGDETIVVDPSISLIPLRDELPRVDRVVNSHCHEDHIAGNHLFPDVPWHLHELDHPGILSLEGLERIYGYSGPIMQAFRQVLLHQFHFVARPDALSYGDGHVFDLGGGVRMRAIHTPGHTRGHCCLLVEPDDLLYLGDIELSSFGPYYGDAWSDLEDFERSLALVRGIEARWYATFHHIGVVDRATFLERIERFAAVIDDRERRLVEYLREPHTLDEIAVHRFVYRPQDPVSFAEAVERRSMGQHVDRLLRRGELREVEPGRYLAS